MDRDFQQKVRRKRFRAIGLAVLVIVIFVGLLVSTDVEKADYSDSLEKELAAAEDLYREASANVGNGEGQYAPYTLLTFRQQADAAAETASSDDSEYNDKKDAYELLKEQNKAFRTAVNRDTLSKADAEQLAKDRAKKTFRVELKEDTEAELSIDGRKLRNPRAMNFMVRAEGPYYAGIADMMGNLELSGQVVSFYQEGSFGGKVRAVIPFYTEKPAKGYAYKVDLKRNRLQFVSEAKISKENQTAAFTAGEGGDYVIVTKKLHKDSQKKSVDIKKEKKKALAAKKNEKTAKSVKQTEKSAKKESGSTAQTKQPSQNTAATGTQAAPARREISVSVEIRCDTLAADLSKLEDPALKHYVPSGGTILSPASVKVKEGETVFDALNKVCRNRGIHLESGYTPAYGSHYIEGINHLYEFDGGSLSGWIYKVNGKFPNYGCSEYEVKNGDRIVWAYSCDLGKDIGGNNGVRQ